MLLYVTPQCSVGSLGGEGKSYQDPAEIPEWYNADMCARCDSLNLADELSFCQELFSPICFYTYFQWTEDGQGFQIQYLTLDT